MVAHPSPSCSPEEPRAVSAAPGPGRGASRVHEGADIHEQLAQADRADRMLLRLVLCAAAATLTLAVAASLVM